MGVQLKRCSLQRKESFDIVQKEINMLQKFAGDYVIKMLGNEILGRHTSTPEAVLLLEFCPGGHLLDRLVAREGKRLSQEEIMRIFGMLLQALAPMHACNPPIVHRDIKLENVLFGVVGDGYFIFEFLVVFASNMLQHRMGKSDSSISDPQSWVTCM